MTGEKDSRAKGRGAKMHPYSHMPYRLESGWRRRSAGEGAVTGQTEVSSSVRAFCASQAREEARLGTISDCPMGIGFLRLLPMRTDPAVMAYAMRLEVFFNWNPL